MAIFQKKNLKEGNQTYWKKFVKIKASIKLADPLMTDFYMDREYGNFIWIQFKYERMAEMFFNCGRLGHRDNNYNFKKFQIIDPKDPVDAYGPWIHVNKPQYDTGTMLSGGNKEKTVVTMPLPKNSQSPPEVCL